jgi:hypothetical protein
MDRPTVLEQFRRGGSYYAKQRPPRLLRWTVSIVVLWLVVLLGMYPIFGPRTFSRPYLIIWACVMAPGTILGFVQIIGRWRRNGPPI